MWTQDLGATIRSELGFPRNVTSIAEPNPGSAYATYSDYGRSDASKRPTCCC